MSRQVQMIVIAVAAIVLSGGGFVAGMTVGPTLGKNEAAASNAPNASGRQLIRQGLGGQGGAGGLAGVGQQVAGQVISVGDGTITVETRQPDGGTTRSVIALVGSDTRVVRNSETDIKLSDIKPGDQVLIVGSTDQSTGTVSANAVVVGVNALQQLFGGFGGGGQVRPGASGSPRPRASGSASPRP